MGAIMYLRVPGSEFQVQGLKDSVKTAHGTRQGEFKRADEAKSKERGAVGQREVHEFVS